MLSAPELSPRIPPEPPLDTVAEYIQARRVSGELRERLLGIGPEDTAWLSPMLVLLRPTANFLQDILSLMDEIAARDRISLAQLAGELDALEPEQELGQKDRQRRLRRELERLRYPETARIEDELERCRREILADCGVRVQYPLDLEGDQLTCDLTFSSADGLREIGESLQAAARHPALHRIYDILKGRW